VDHKKYVAEDVNTPRRLGHPPPIVDVVIPNKDGLTGEEEINRRVKPTFDEIVSLIIDDFATWLWAEQTAVRAVHRLDSREASRAVSIAVLRVAGVRMRVLGVTLDEVIEVAKQAYESGKVKP
jgi:hypothetical protein